MVVASRNDLTFHIEQEFKQVNEKAAKDALVSRGQKKGQMRGKHSDCLCGIYHFNTIYLFR